MPLVSNVGRKSLAVRLLVGVLYVLVIAGAVTMIYPFLVTVSGSFKTSVDQNDFDAVPAFFYDDLVLYRKYLECKYNNRLLDCNMFNRSQFYEFRKIDPPETIHNQRVADWTSFEESGVIQPANYNLGFMAHAGDRLRLWKNREFRDYLMNLCHGNIEEYNERFNAEVEKWISVGQVEERLTERRFQVTDSPFTRQFYKFKTQQAPWFRLYPCIDGVYVQNVLRPIYGTDVKDFNEKMGTHCASFNDYVLPRTLPKNERERPDWDHYVRDELNLQWVRAFPEALPLFTKFLKKRYDDDIKTLNERYGATYASFDDVPFPDDYITVSFPLVDWAAFVAEIPGKHLYLKTNAFNWRDFLKEKYKGDLDALNHAHEAEYASFEVVPMPTREVDCAEFLKHKKALRREFVSANYKQVVDYIFLHGRSLWNTVIYCGLAIITALIVNPLAAYALSRYKIPSTYKLLLFCMATMAFPPAVTMIPSFLLLKELNLLNTFAALVLPGMANGFMIFLLKGFFDSLPREMYESAQIDGAGEWVMFWNFTMALSKPILAVLALGAFTAAYGNFMFAFILCPDERMWTLMVFLYQFQQGGAMGLTFAALLVAAIPTFVVFVFCQNIIIRGIVVPVEK